MVCVDAEYDILSEYKFSHNDNVGTKESLEHLNTSQLTSRLLT